jgi:hypothetical protein
LGPAPASPRLVPPTAAGAGRSGSLCIPTIRKSTSDIARTPVSQCFSEGTASGCRSCAYFRIQGIRCHGCNSYVPTMHACSGRRPVQSVGDSTVLPTTWVVTRETCLHSDFAGNCD